MQIIFEKFPYFSPQELKGNISRSHLDDFHLFTTGNVRYLREWDKQFSHTLVTLMRSEMRYKWGKMNNACKIAKLRRECYFISTFGLKQRCISNSVGFLQSKRWKPNLNQAWEAVYMIPAFRLRIKRWHNSPVEQKIHTRW